MCNYKHGGQHGCRGRYVVTNVEVNTGVAVVTNMEVTRA